MTGEQDLGPAAAAVPRIRPLIRGARARNIRAEERSDYLPWVFGFFIVLANVVLAWSDDQEGELAHLGPVLFGVGFAILFEICRRANLIGAALVLLVTDAANVVGTGKLLTYGADFIHLHVTSESVALGMANVLLFCTVMVLGAWGVDWIVNYTTRHRSMPVENLSLRRFDRFTLLLLTAITFGWAIARGAWTSYGAILDDTPGDRPFQWEMLYDPLIANCVIVGVDDTLRLVEHRTSTARRISTVALLSLLMLLVFARQYRRQMVALMVTSVLMIISSPVVLSMLRHSIRRMVLLLMLLVATAVALNFGSLAWRRSSTTFVTNNPIERLADSVGRLGEIDESDLANTRKRFTYLTVDAGAIEFRPLVGDILELEDMFVRSIAFAIPRIIFPGKVRYMPPTCETAFYAIVPEDTDLACTTSAEGYLAAGIWGVIAVGIPFAIIGAVASFMLRRRSVLSLVAGFQLIYPLTSLEGSAFSPAAYAVRALILVPGALFAVRSAFQLIVGWHNWQQRPATRTRPTMGAVRST